MDKHDDVSKAYKQLEQPEPRSDLDRMILRAAREELESNQGETQQNSFWQHWFKPLSAVAVMGLCLAVVLQVMNFNPDRIDSNAPDADFAASSPGRAEAETDFREEIVAARKSAQLFQRQAAPASVSALEEIVVNLQQPSPSLAENALELWNATGKAAADVWLAGIERSKDFMAAKAIDAELEKLNRTYPDSSASESKQEQPANSEADIASYWAWQEGIEHLYDTGDEVRADAETEKLLRIYPAGQPSR